MPADPIDTSNGTSFSEIKAAYVAVNATSGDSALRDGKTTTPILMSYFREATFTSGDPVPASSDSDDEISIVPDFCTIDGSGNLNGRTFVGCFEISTLVHMGDGSTKTYGELVSGDIVKSFSIKGLTETDDPTIYLNEQIDTLTGAETTSIVQFITIITQDSYYLINNSIRVTGEHPLMIKRNDTWKWRKVQNLQQSDKLYNVSNGETNIDSIENILDMVNVAMIGVSDINTYFAGDILAHNK